MGRSHQISDWDPEDSVAWEAGNKFIARRNLIWSVAAEHVGFSVWSLWSVMVLFMPTSVYGFSAGDKFLLGATATLVGACLRFPYTFATAKFGAQLDHLFRTGAVDSDRWQHSVAGQPWFATVAVSGVRCASRPRRRQLRRLHDEHQRFLSATTQGRRACAQRGWRQPRCRWCSWSACW